MAEEELAKEFARRMKPLLFDSTWRSTVVDWDDPCEPLLARIAELEAELDDTLKDAEDWERRAAANKRKLLVAEARIEHLEAALREALSHIPQANTLKPHYERENVVREILERALTTSTQEDSAP